MLYILRPLRSFGVTPIATGVPDKIPKYMTPHVDHAAFMAVMYSVLLAEHFKDINTVIRTVFFCTLALMCLLFIIQLTKEKMLSCSGKLCRRVYSKVQPLVAACSFSLLPSLPLALLLYTRFASGAGKPDSTQSQSADSKGTPAPECIIIEVKQRTGESNEMETLGEEAENCEEQEEQINS
ncbi:unnamed protein product [Leuciscus chuanchicus]